MTKTTTARNATPFKGHAFGLLSIAGCLILAAICLPAMATGKWNNSLASLTTAPSGSALQDETNSGGDSKQSQDSADEQASTADSDDPMRAKKPPEIVEDQLVRLDPDLRIWFDRVDKFVVLDGEVCLRQGQLEVFACPAGTKEHEAVVKVFSDAFHVHLALLRIGAVPGSPVSFDPMYKAAEGMVIDVWVVWEDEEGAKKSARAQEWVRNSKTEKQLDQDWVFGGSGFWVDEETEERFYMAEGGELICLSNFSTATMDLPIESSDSNDALLFEPFTERVPNRGTKIRLILKPQIPTKDEAGDDDTQGDDDTKGDDGTKDDDDGDANGDSDDGGMSR